MDILCTSASSETRPPNQNREGGYGWSRGGPWEGRVGSCDVCVNSVKGPFPPLGLDIGGHNGQSTGRDSSPCGPLPSPSRPVVPLVRGHAMDADDEASTIHARAENADETGEGRVCRRRTFFDDAGRALSRARSCARSRSTAR